MNKDYDNTELFEPTHRDNEPTFSFDGFLTLVVAGIVLWGILMVILLK